MLQKREYNLNHAKIEAAAETMIPDGHELCFPDFWTTEVDGRKYPTTSIVNHLNDGGHLSWYCVVDGKTGFEQLREGKNK